MESIKVMLIVVYIPLVFIALFGNSCLLIALYKHNHLRSSFNIYLGNLALSDLMFILFSIFQVVEYVMDEWFLGDVFCRIQGTLIEITYTVSVLTLSVVAVERYISICRSSLRQNVMNSQSLKCTGFIWFAALLICSPQIYGRSVRSSNKGSMHCDTNYWSCEVKLIYYSIHTLVVYVIPLLIMVTTNYIIFTFLRNKIRITVDLHREYMLHNIDSPAQERRSIMETLYRQRQRNRKVINILLVVTLVFFLLWSPFIIIRLLRYSYISVPPILWKTSQFMILTTAVVNFFIYAVMSPDLRKVFKSFIPCISSE